MDRKNHLYLYALVVLLVWTGCRKDQPPSPSGDKGEMPQGELVWVACEGNLGAGNSQLGLYDPQTGNYQDNLLPLAEGESLGDILESIALGDQRLYLLLNNSDRIRVLDKESRTWIGSMNVPKPRRMLLMEGDKAYVSSLYSQIVYVINTRTLTVEKEIPLPYANAESLIKLGDEVWVACWDLGCRELLILDSRSDQWIGSVSLPGAAPHTLARAPGDKLWVLSGNAAEGLGTQLSRVDLQRREAEFSLAFPEDTEGLRLAVDSARGWLYYIGLDFQGGKDPYGLFRMDLEDTLLPKQPWIPAEKNQYFWGLGLHPRTGDLYLADPRGFIQKGEVRRYSAEGEWQDAFETAMGPNSFYFDGEP